MTRDPLRRETPAETFERSLEDNLHEVARLPVRPYLSAREQQTAEGFAGLLASYGISVERRLRGTSPDGLRGLLPKGVKVPLSDHPSILRNVEGFPVGALVEVHRPIGEAERAELDAFCVEHDFTYTVLPGGGVFHQAEEAVLLLRCDYRGRPIVSRDEGEPIMRRVYDRFLRRKGSQP